MPSKPVARLILLALALVPLAACSSTGSAVDDRPLDERYNRPEPLDESTQAMMLKLDKLMNDWVMLTRESSSPSDDAKLERVDSYLREAATTEFDVLMEAAMSDVRLQRATASAVLGFSGREEALDPLLNLARDDDPQISDNAVLSLAILGDPRTPPGVLASIAGDEERAPASRGQAAWALYSIQQNVIPEEQARYREVWLGLLGDRIDSEPDAMVAQVLRGLGYTRDESLREVVEPYLDHPTPRVRMATAVALGRFGDAAAAPALIERLGSKETNLNVRMAARKALQSLAGGVDRGYNRSEWERVFDRGDG